ncbi:MAG: AGE family epimerase/isomerase [Anaerolineales bacterium]|nr:AGE family epimerase/isomerase [Anaerolineales bacterium]
MAPANSIIDALLVNEDRKMLFDTAMISQIQASMTQHFEQALIPFWIERGPDKEFGGFLTNFDEDGHHRGTPEKYLNTQARLVWWFSALYRRYPQQDGFMEIAEQGVEFLLKHFWDKQYGGWYWKVEQDGKCLDNGKVVYGQSFAIYGLAEYYRATGDLRGLDYASITFDLLQKYCTDTFNGGYYENLDTDWTVSDSGFAGGDRKGLDTHMHLLESFTTLYAASKQDIHHRKLLEVLNLIVKHMIDPVAGCGRNQFALNFEPVPAIAIKRTWNAERQGDTPPIPTDTTSFGHNIELAWLISRAVDIAGIEKESYLRVVAKLADHGLQYGIDQTYGGIYRDGKADGQVLVDEKEWWQHTEALIGLLDAFVLFKDERYWNGFINVWEFVSKHMINHKVGEWYTLLNRTGEPIVTQMGNEWKAAYHTGRSMLECTERLAKMQQSISGKRSIDSDEPEIMPHN